MQSRNADPVYHACIQQAVNDLRPAGVVLDCGCGTGFATRLLLGRSRALHALDFSIASLEELKRKFPERIDPDRARRRARNLPYPDAHFDRVLVANVLQHLTPPDQRLAAAEVMRVLKPGGRYSVSVHHFSVREAARRLEERRQAWAARPRSTTSSATRATSWPLIFPGGKVRAIGFYGWPSQVQILIELDLLGERLRRWGRGHMLCAAGVRRLRGPRIAVAT